jgi:hypothetical protein
MGGVRMTRKSQQDLMRAEFEAWVQDLRLRYGRCVVARLFRGMASRVEPATPSAAGVGRIMQFRPTALATARRTSAARTTALLVVTKRESA